MPLRIHFAIAVIVFSISQPLTAEAGQITLLLTSSTGKQIQRQVPADSTALAFFDGDSQPYEITSIANLDRLEHLQALEFYNISGIKDFGFLSKLVHLKTLYMASVTVRSFQFLESMSGLEAIHFSYDAPGSESAVRASDPIDLRGLTNLKFVLLSGPAEVGVLPLVSVSGRPFISLANSGIVRLSTRELATLRQFGAVYLAANPIADTKEVRERLKGSEVFFDDDDLPSAYISLYRKYEG